jgi:ribosome-dependent ATPase
MNGFWAILLKELAHIRRDRFTVIFAFVIPAVQMTVFGYAIEASIDNIPLVVLDLDGRQDSRALVEAMVNTRSFKVVQRVYSVKAVHEALDAGRAKAGLIIPADYSEKLLRQEQAQIQVLIDGSDSQVASTALNTVNLLGTTRALTQGKTLVESTQTVLARGPAGEATLPVDVRARLLYNPNLESSHFFVPGLIAIILQLLLLFLTSFSIVREREQGTLEQLFVTPVGRAGLMFGKLLPYSFMAFGELLIVLMLMVAIFRVPINGQLWLLLLTSSLFIVTVLGLGLLISTVADTQLKAIQFAFMMMMPSVLLSGFMFPRSQMPLPVYLIGWLVPATYYVEILRGVILRSASATELLPFIGGLAACCLVVLTLSMARFHKQLG